MLNGAIIPLVSYKPEIYYMDYMHFLGIAFRPQPMTYTCKFHHSRNLKDIKPIQNRYSLDDALI